MHEHFRFFAAESGFFQIIFEAANIVILHPAFINGADAFIVAFADLDRQLTLQLVHVLLVDGQLVLGAAQGHFGLVFQLGAIIEHLLQFELKHHPVSLRVKSNPCRLFAV